MAPGTPGRARKDKHVPFNNKPKEVGTRTGAPMPTNVPRDSMGFEDPDAFFKSPTGQSVAGNTTFARTPGGMTDVTTPGTARTSRRSTRGRMSRLAGGSDEEDAGALGDEGLGDDDDLGLNTPAVRPYFSGSNPPSVNLPRRSELPPASPSMAYDSLPSPSSTSIAPQQSKKRKSTIGVNYTPHATSTPKASAPPPVEGNDTDELDLDGMDGLDTFGAGLDSGMADEEDEDELERSMVLDQAAGSSVSPEKRKRAAAEKRSNKTPEKSRGRVSNLSAKRGRADPDEDDENGEEGGGEGDETVGAASLGFDLGDADDGDDGGIQRDEVDLGDESRFDGAGDDDDEHLDNGNGHVEEEDDDEREAENGEGSDQEEETRPAAKRPRGRPQPEASNARTAGHQRGRAPQPRIIVQKKKSRVSRLPEEEEDGDGVHGDFKMRRSGRTHFKPLQYWRGERFDYQRGPNLPVITEVTRLPDEDIKPLGGARRTARARTGRSRSKSVMGGRGAEGDWPEHPEEGLDLETEPIGVVREYPSGTELHRRIAFPKSRLEPRMVPGSNFKYQKVFGEDQFIAAGVVYIPPGGMKPGKHSKDNAYVFHVMQGAVQVRVHRASFIMAPGAMFMVPRGNHYEIENISDGTEARLFFAQARKIRQGEEDDGETEAEPSQRATLGPGEDGEGAKKAGKKIKGK